MKKRGKDMAERYDSNPLAPIMDYMDYIDFIDAPTVRDHLRTLPPLPPAQQCILIAQSDIRPLTDKLAALREIRDATPPEDFSRGCWKFQCDDPFPVILDLSCSRNTERRLSRPPTFRKISVCSWRYRSSCVANTI